MSANIDKMSIVIKNYFSAECDVDTTIRQAYERGFRRGASACEALNMHIRELSDEHDKLCEENAKLRELATETVRFIQAGEQDCGLCKHFDECWTGEAMNYSPNGCVICNEARELGIEVSK